MEFRSVHETAKEWGVSDRLVQRLCADGRIQGARKLSGAWAIPAGVIKPQDPRKREALSEDFRIPVEGDMSEADVLSRLMPLLNTDFEPGRCQEAIERLVDPDVRQVARAEFCYFSGQAEEAARISGGLLGHKDLPVRLSACLIYAYANLPLGNIGSARYALTELRLALGQGRFATGGQNRIVEAFAAYAASVLLHLPLPDNMPPASAFLTMLPPGLKSFAMYVHAHQLYLQGDYSRSLGLAEATLMMGDRVYPIPRIYLHLVAVMDCMSLKRTDSARDHLLAAWGLARPDGLIEAFGEHHGLLGGMLESTLKKDWPEDFKRIIDITYRFSSGWRRIHNPATEDKVADNLTTTEFAVSMLAARGWTNQEIGGHLGVSVNTVKSYLASSFRKLGVGRRQDLAEYMLR